MSNVIRRWQKSKLKIVAFYTVLFFGLGSCITSKDAGLSVTVPKEAAKKSAIVRYDSIHHPVIAAKGMVVSQNALASKVGRDVLDKGGNAVDAAVATAFALAVTLPRAGNLGGSGFMLIYLAKSGETIALDYRSMAPENMTETVFTDGFGKMLWERIKFGPLAPAVPGTVAGIYEAWERFGSLPWQDLVQPAEELARAGIVVSDDLAYVLEEASPVLSRFPSSKKIFLKADGTNYSPGERLVQLDLAWSLAQIKEHGADSFYRGKLAKRIVDGLQRDGGVISYEDYNAYQVRERQPIKEDYRGHTVLSMPPVSGGGVTLIQMLKVLEHFDLSALPRGGADSLHILAETMKRSAANRRVGLGDPDFVDVPIEGFISDELAKKLADEISSYKATPVAKIYPKDADQFESPETTHFSIVDKNGNAVSNTYTLGYSFGSGYIAPGTGILLDNQVRNFTYGKPGHANTIAPGKRMLSTMTPTIVLNPSGDLMLVTGTPGGGRIINVVLQILVNVIDYDLNIAEATHAPRIHQQWRTPMLGVETGIGVDTIKLLESRGHEVQIQPTMGSTQSILVDDGLLHGAADPRRPGALAIGLH